MGTLFIKKHIKELQHQEMVNTRQNSGYYLFHLFNSECVIRYHFRDIGTLFSTIILCFIGIYVYIYICIYIYNFLS